MNLNELYCIIELHFCELSTITQEDFKPVLFIQIIRIDYKIIKNA